MSVAPAEQTPEKTGVRYVEPVVQGFYGAVISALEDAPDGASAATRITGEFQRHHTGWTQSATALRNDVRRLSADEGVKATMLTHASRYAGRMLEENLRLHGQVHAHQDVEAKLHDLAGQLEETQGGIAAQLREILHSLTPPVPPAVGHVVVSSAVDQRWTCGWFRDETRTDGPLQPLPFAGWVLVAEDPHAASQHVESAFLLSGTWYTKGELRERGLSLQRID